jgi:ATP-dependent Clp protease ATP-binding subunit ClpA
MKVIEDVQRARGEIVLFIDELHTVVGAGATGEGSMDAGDMFKPVLARGELHVVGATTIDEYRKYVEKDAALERRTVQTELDDRVADLLLGGETEPGDTIVADVREDTLHCTVRKPG